MEELGDVKREKKLVFRKVDDLDQTYALSDQQGQGWRSQLRSWLRRKRSKFTCSKVFHTNFPIVSSFKGYRPLSDLPGDVISGLTVGVMHIPQGQLTKQM
jgi:hypothetical protein